MVVEVLDGGPLTTIQDLPGRLGYWGVGVPPSGPMDDLAHRLANRVVGNDDEAPALEMTTAGPTLRADGPLTIAVGGAAMRTTVDGVPVPGWTAVEVPAGAAVRVGAVDGPGMRATLAVRGGVVGESYLGSCATFTLGGFGGHHGRALRAGDELVMGSTPTGPTGAMPPGLAPLLGHDWELGVLVGPHAAPDYLTHDGLHALLRAEWIVHHNSARTGIRLVGPRPTWARADGGDAGLHPSNIHDTGYAVGAVDLTGDMPIILGPDGPSLGGFVCPAVVVASQRWKLGQLAPGDRVRLVAWTAVDAAAADHRRSTWLARATRPVEPLARPSWNAPLPRPAGRDDGVIARRDPDRAHPGVTYRRAGDRFLLVEYGPMSLDLALRVRVHLLERWARQHLRDVVDLTPGVRSLLVQVDGRRLSVDGAQLLMSDAEDDLDDVEHAALSSRVVHLPLSWDDPATRQAIERYIHGVRADAPWCPWNIEFIRRINGLDDVDRSPPHRLRRVLPRRRARRCLPGRTRCDAARPAAPPRHDEVQPRPHVDPRERRRHRRCVPVHLRHGGSRRLPVRRPDGAGVEPRPARPALRGAVAAPAVRPAPVPSRHRGRAPRPAGGAVGWAVGHPRGGGHLLPCRPPRLPRCPRRGDRGVPDAAAARLRRGARSVDVDRRVVMTSAVDAVGQAFERILADGRDGIWITLVERSAAIAAARSVDERRSRGTSLPLAGATLAVKDNIDVAGLPTTAGCTAYAYETSADAPAVAALTAAGAVVIGKTNLDQFATGLVGVRSPYGITPNAHWDGLIAGGSSSGSAVAVATGMVDLALGTDTAGSGRVPAACNGIVGVKPTRLRISTRGVVPACRTLDCVTVFARSINDAARATALARRSRPAADGTAEAPVTSRRSRPPQSDV